MTTIREVEECGKEMLLPADIAPIFGADPQSIRIQAKKDPKSFGFPVCVVGSRTYIPREGFLRYCKALYIGEPASL